jgi:hypothetical protein
MEMRRPGVGAANTLFFLWRVLRLPTAPASRTKIRRTPEESQTTTVAVEKNCSENQIKFN